MANNHPVNPNQNDQNMDLTEETVLRNPKFVNSPSNYGNIVEIAMLPQELIWGATHNTSLGNVDLQWLAQLEFMRGPQIDITGSLPSFPVVTHLMSHEDQVSNGRRLDTGPPILSAFTQPGNYSLSDEFESVHTEGLERKPEGQQMESNPILLPEPDTAECYTGRVLASRQRESQSR
jgi:hypothetical protein